MSFLIYYGAGEVRYDQFGGVDLSALMCCAVPVVAPERRSIGWVRDWLHGTFMMDAEIYEMNLHGLEWKGVWMLRPINRSREWMQWLRDVRMVSNAQLMLLVQFRNKEVSAALALSQLQVDEAPRFGPLEQTDVVDETEVIDGEATLHLDTDCVDGQADEGEIREVLVHNMEMDDQRAATEDAEIQADEREEGDGGDAQSIDDEDEPSDPMPASWRPEVRGGMSVQDDRSQQWEYHENEVLEGGLYNDKEAVKNAIRLWGMSTQREFRTKTSSPRQYTAVCVEPTCGCSVHASIGKYEVQWCIRSVTPHTCVRDGVLGQHRNLSASLIASLFYHEIVENVTIVENATTCTLTESTRPHMDG